MCMYGLCPCACVAYDLIKVMLLKKQKQKLYRVEVFYKDFGIVLNVYSEDECLL